MILCSMTYQFPSYNLGTHTVIRISIRTLCVICTISSWFILHCSVETSSCACTLTQVPIVWLGCWSCATSRFLGCRCVTSCSPSFDSLRLCVRSSSFLWLYNLLAVALILIHERFGPAHFSLLLPLIWQIGHFLYLFLSSFHFSFIVTPKFGAWPDGL